MATTHEKFRSFISVLPAILLIAGFGCTVTPIPAAPSPMHSARQEPPGTDASPDIRPEARQRKTIRTVYLTFDADMTPAMKRRLEEKKVSFWYDQGLVDYLRKENVPATIFTTGMFAELYPVLVKDLAEDGRFSIQNHSYDHAGFESPCYGLNELSTDDQRRAEITKTQAILKTLTGYAPTLFRFPGLCKNAHDDAIVTSLGLQVNDGNLVSGDAFSHDAARIAMHVIDTAVDGSVVVMHLGGPNATATPRAVMLIVPALRAKGFVFEKLP